MAGEPNRPEAFSRVVIDDLLKEVGRPLTDGQSVRYEVPLPGGTRADYVLCDCYGRSLAVIEAKRAAQNLLEASEQELFSGLSVSMQSIQSQQSTATATATAKAQVASDALLSQFFGTA